MGSIFYVARLWRPLSSIDLAPEAVFFVCGGSHTLDLASPGDATPTRVINGLGTEHYSFTEYFLLC